MIIDTILRIIANGQEIYLEMLKGASPEDKVAIAARYNTFMDFWHGVFTRRDTQ